MKIVKTLSCLSGKSIILNNSFRSPDYTDSYMVTIKGEPNYSADYLMTLFFTSVLSWIKLPLRNVLVKPLGLKTGSVNIFNPQKKLFIKQGKRQFFLRFCKKAKKKQCWQKKTNILISELPSG